MEERRMSEIRSNADLIWGVAELLRGDYKQADYGKVILPLVLMRRLDQALEATKANVISRAEKLEAADTSESGMELVLLRVTKLPYFNRSKISFPQVLDDPSNIAQYLKAYIDGYSTLAREVIDKFEFERHIDRLGAANLLFQVIGRICKVDLHPSRVSNLEMGYLFEELIRRFAEASNETAGEHFTPREVVRLMVNLLIDGDEAALREPGAIRTVFDPACGTGGMLTEADSHIRELNPSAEVLLYGQELNPESYAICLADMLVKGKDPNIVNGNSLSADGHPGQQFHYGIANPPFGVDWSKVEKEVRREHDELGFDGRFGAGLPPKDDGQLLFLQHLVSKMRDPEAGGSRVAIVFNGSPLFSGKATSSVTRIRKWLIEEDLLEAVVALPEQLFYNTGIATYVWVVSNRKRPERVDKVQLIDARALWERMHKSLGEKRRFIPGEAVDRITQLHGEFTEGDHVRILEREQLGYRTVIVDRPLRGAWRVEPSTWAGVDHEPALKRLGQDICEAVGEALADMPCGEWTDEASARAAVVRSLRPVVTRPPAPLIRVLLDRMLRRDPEGPVLRGSGGRPILDPSLRDTENVALTESVQAHLEGEVLPLAPDAWVADPEGEVGYEIPFGRFFFVHTPPRDLQVLDDEAAGLERRVTVLLEDVARARTRSIGQAIAGSGPELVESGLPWLERIPAHWTVARIKRLARLGSGHTPSRSKPEYWEDCTIRWITTGEVAQIRDDRREVISETREKISELGLANSAAVLHPAGTVVLSRTASAGFSAVMDTDMATSQDFVTWTCGPRLDPFYLLHCLRAMREDLLGRLAIGSTHKTIYMPDIEGLKIPLPPIGEQRQIVELIREQTARLDELTDVLGEQLALLNERRRALVVSAISGALGTGVTAAALEDALA